MRTALPTLLALGCLTQAAAAASGGKYVLLDVPYTSAGVPVQRYTTPQGGKANPWSFSHALVTLVQSGPEFSDFRDAEGRILRVTAPDGQLHGIYPVIWERKLSQVWRGNAWAYGGLDYACRLGAEDSVAFRLQPDQPLKIAQMYRVQGRLPGVSHRNTFSAGISFSDDPVPAAAPLLVEFSAPDWTATGGSGSGYLENRNRAPNVCKTGFLPLLDQGGLDRNLSHAALPARPFAQRWKQPRGEADLYFRGWKRTEIRTAFGSPDEPGTLAQLDRLNRWTYQGPMAEFYRFTFRGGRVAGAEERHMP